MRIAPVFGESPSAYEVRQAAATRAMSNFPAVHRFESGVGLTPSSAPIWERFGSPQHSTFESPLVGLDSAAQLAKMDYFGWQAMQSLERYGTIRPTPLGRDFFPGPDPIGEIFFNPLPANASGGEVFGGGGPLEQLAMESRQGRNQGKIIGLPGQGTHSFTDYPDNWQSDNAVDVRLRERTPIYAIAKGVISTSYGFGDTGQSGRMAGKRLHLEYMHNVAYYAHLSELVVSPGQRVNAGDLLGYSGSANGVPHLHFALKAKNPLKWINHPNRKPY